MDAEVCRRTHDEARLAREFASKIYYYKAHQSAHDLLQAEQRITRQCSEATLSGPAAEIHPAVRVPHSLPQSSMKWLESDLACLRTQTSDERARLYAPSFASKLFRLGEWSSSLANLREREDALQVMQVFHDQVTSILAQHDEMRDLWSEPALKAAATSLEDRSESLGAVEMDRFARMEELSLREHFRGLLEAGLEE